MVKKKQKISEKTEMKKPDVQADAAGDLIGKVFSGQAEKDAQHTKAEDVSLIISEWLAPRHVLRKTRYSKRQVRAVTTLESLANTYNIKTLKRYLSVFRVSKLSEDGQSSKELENILKSRMPAEEDVELRKLSKFLE